MNEVLVNRLGGLSLSRKSVVRLTDHPDMILDVYRRRKSTTTTRSFVDSLPLNTKEFLFTLTKENCNLAPLRYTHIYFHYVHNKYARFQKDPLKTDRQGQILKPLTIVTRA